MLDRLIDFHLAHRWFVLVGLAGIVALGLYTVSQIPIEAFPDLTNNQVVVITECPAMAPSEVEQLVTFPIETALMGLPKTQGIRSISKLGLSMVTLLFEDSVNVYFARQIVGERLQEVRPRLPAGLEPGLGPVATAFGEVYQYTLGGEGRSPMELKSIHEVLVKNQLRTVPGVNEVNTWGGETRQYHVEADPARLQSYGLSLRDLYERIRENNANFGGGFIEHASEQYTVRGLGRLQDAADLEKIVVLARAGTPVLLRDVAAVLVKPMPRQGAVLRDGKGETVSGMVIMLKGENGKQVIARVKQRLASLRLPDGVRLIPFYASRLPSRSRSASASSRSCAAFPRWKAWSASWAAPTWPLRPWVSTRPTSTCCSSRAGSGRRARRRNSSPGCRPPWKPCLGWSITSPSRWPCGWMKPFPASRPTSP